MENIDDLLKMDVAEEKPDLPSFLQDVDFDKFKPQWGTMVNGFTLPRYTLSYKDIPFAPLDGIHAITGQSGHGKTMTFSVIMAAILNGEYMGLRWNLPDIEPKVLYIDTEMELRNTMMVISRVHAMCGTPLNVDREDFKWLNLRDVEKADDRWNYVTVAIEEYRPTVVFLDGNLDLVNDFNDNQQCQEHIRRCMQAASYHAGSIWCLVHENPGSTKMVGHLGSMLERKVTDLLVTKKNKDKGGTHPVFEVEAKKTRGRDIPSIKFTVEQDKYSLGIPTIVDALQGPEDEKKEEGVKMSVQEVMRKAFAKKQAYSTRGLSEAIKGMLSIGSSKAYSYIEDAVSMRLINKGQAPDGNGYIYTLTRDDEKMFTNDVSGTPQELPF